jgi:hypothetical protein
MSFPQNRPAISVSFSVLLLVAASIIAGCDKSGQAPKQGNIIPTATSPSVDIVLQDWGPKDTRLGEPFNIQPDKSSAIWISVTGVKEHPETTVTWAGTALENVFVGPKLVTAAVPASLLQKAGQFDIAIQEGNGGRKLTVGTFTINP